MNKMEYILFITNYYYMRITTVLWQKTFYIYQLTVQICRWDAIETYVDKSKLKYAWRLLNLPPDNIYRKVFIYRFFTILYRGIFYSESPVAQFINVCFKYNVLDNVIDILLSGTLPSKIEWCNYVNNNVNDRQFSIWRRSLKMYSSLKLYRIISCKYERICWIDLCISERYLLFACRTVIRLIVGNSCLSAHSQHIRAEKVCRLCELGVQEDLFHFVWQCIYFDDMRNQMFLKIKDNISEDTYQTLQNVPSNIYFYILLGMQFPINFNDLYTIRKISVRSIFKMYKKRQDFDKSDDE